MDLSFLFFNNKKEKFILGEDEQEKREPYQHNEGGKRLTGYYFTDLNTLKKEFSLNVSNDIKFREFTVEINHENTDACIFYADGLINKELVNDFVLLPLMLHSRQIHVKSADEVKDVLLPQSEVVEDIYIDQLAYALNYGSVILMIKGLKGALSLDIKGWQSKAIGEPQTEKVIRGPNDAFNEQLRANTGLIRRLIRNKSLIFKEMKLGLISQTPCSVMYMKNIANDKLVNEVIKRVESINTDYIMTSGELELYLEDKTYSAIPQFISTERPDKTAKALLDGKVAILVDGSPYALLMPVTFFELNEATEDMYLRVPYSNMLKTIRMAAFFLSVLLPGLYIAIMNFHNELLPTNLLIAIIAAKQTVPFPAFIELIFMEVALEIIREAGVRVPTPSGSTLSIVGALILGQAAVEAKIVSPVVIIVVSLAAIGSFATPNYYLGLSARVMKFVYIFLGGFLGLLGIMTGLFVQSVLWVNTYSLGVPMFAPMAPKTFKSGTDGIFIDAIKNRKKRSDYQNPKRKYKESRG